MINCSHNMYLASSDVRKRSRCWTLA